MHRSRHVINATDGEWLPDHLADAKARRRRLILPTEKPIEISRMVVNDGVPLRLEPWARGPATIKWASKKRGVMMELRNTGKGDDRTLPWCFGLEKIQFDGAGLASALRSYSGFTKGATVDRCGFWDCVGPVIDMRACWSSLFLRLKFAQCRGGLMNLEDHSAGIVSIVNVGYCKTNGDGRPALRFVGSNGVVEHVSLDSWTHYRGRPLVQLENCKSKRVADVRLEGGKNKGVEGSSAVELRNCKACGVVDVRAVFNPLRPGHCGVRVKDGEDNYLLGICGGRPGTLTKGRGRNQGCIVEATMGSVIINEMSISHDVKPGQPKHYPDLVELPRERGES